MKAPLYLPLLSPYVLLVGRHYLQILAYHTFISVFFFLFGFTERDAEKDAFG